jgi:hypothetical protein
MRYGISLLALLFALNVGISPVLAQGRGNGQAKKAAPRSTQGGGKHTGAKAAAKPANGKKATTVASTSGESKIKAKPEKAPKPMQVASTPPAPVTLPAPVTPTTPTTRAIKNPRLEARLLTLLPPGSTIQNASAGFRNWGQFVAAVHVSNNLNIPFVDLKARMTGIAPGTLPGTVVQGAPMSLGQAIQSFRGVPAAGTPVIEPLTRTKIRNEVKKAEDAANADLRRTREGN